MIRAYIKSIAYCVPDKIVTNDDLSKIMDTSDEWIISHTGIKKRHFIGENENNSDIAAKAAKIAMKKGGITADEIDFIIVCTGSADYLGFPATACLVQEKLGAKNAGAYDISAACTGFVFGVETAANFIKSGNYKNILVIGSEVLSRIIDMSDRNTAVLFGDGAGAALISGNEDSESKSEIISSYLRADGSGENALKRPLGGTAHPFIPGVTDPKECFIYMNGRQVYNFAVKAVTNTILQIMEKNNLTIDSIKYIIPHQANIRIIEAAANRASIPIEKFYINIENYANTSAATIPIALTEVVDKNLIQRGDNIITVGFGGGLTYGGNYIKW
ncbi:MAG: ketoacyl-ACP synthase III [Spirochaetaceae bacterium]|nr:ketoacyl-ACP synthase III [Spirochaetaceae bacterium]